VSGQRPVTTQTVVRGRAKRSPEILRGKQSMASTESKSSLIIPGQGAGEATPSCWSCGTMRAVHFCSSCGKVQPPVPVDYFTFFGFPRKLDLDTADLEKEFYALSRRLHPDVFGQADERERSWSLEQSSMLNDAYRTLKDPIKRTEYLLRLEGIELEEQSKQATEKARATGELKKQVVPPDLLEEVFELNMHLEELRAQKKLGEDDPALLEEIGKAKLSLEEKYDALFNELKNEWNSWDKLVESSKANESDAERKKILDRMLDILNRRNYVRNLVRDVNEAME
jgi:molecular chaperone HscB